MLILKYPNSYFLDTMRFSADIHVPLRMDFNNFGDPVTFPLVSSPGQNFSLSVLGFMTKYLQH